MSLSKYTITWEQGQGHSIGKKKFAGQTRDRRLTETAIIRTTYGYNEIWDRETKLSFGMLVSTGKLVPTGMVATVSEVIDSSILSTEHKKTNPVKEIEN